MNERFLGEIVLPGVTWSVPVARRCAGEILAAAGHRNVERAHLVVSELVGNAVLHTASGLSGGLVTVEIVAVDAVTARIAVTDDGAETVPRPREPDEVSCDGRGLMLVERMSARWGARTLGGGRRTVWAETPTVPEAGSAWSEPGCR